MASASGFLFFKLAFSFPFFSENGKTSCFWLPDFGFIAKVKIETKNYPPELKIGEAENHLASSSSSQTCSASISGFSFLLQKYQNFQFLALLATSFSTALLRGEKQLVFHVLPWILKRTLCGKNSFWLFSDSKSLRYPQIQKLSSSVR